MIKRSPKADRVALWQQRFSEFQAGSMTVSQFCQSISCSVASFYQWRKKLSSPLPDRVWRKSTMQAVEHQSTKQAVPASSQSVATSAFLPVVLRGSAVLVTLSNGTRLELACDPQAALLAILQQQAEV